MLIYELHSRLLNDRLTSLTKHESDAQIISRLTANETCKLTGQFRGTQRVSQDSPAFFDLRKIPVGPLRIIRCLACHSMLNVCVYVCAVISVCAGVLHSK